jgi:hypothetical protein
MEIMHALRLSWTHWGRRIAAPLRYAIARELLAAFSSFNHAGGVAGKQVTSRWAVPCVNVQESVGRRLPV